MSPPVCTCDLDRAWRPKHNTPSDLLTGADIEAFTISGDRETPHTTKPGRAS